MLDLLVMATVASAALAGSGNLAEAPVVAIKAKTLLTGAGAASTGWLVVRDGKIAEIGAPEPPAGAWALEFEDGVLCAGMVDPVTNLGARGDLEETVRAITAQAWAVDSLHSDHSSFRAAARGGLTTVGLVPSGANLVGGRVAVLHTSGARDLATAAGEGPLRMNLTSEAYSRSREPTSRMGAMPLLRRSFAGELAGTKPVLIEAHSPDEIRLALSLPRGPNRDLILLHPERIDEAPELLDGSSALVILGPFGLATATRRLRLAGLLAEREVPVAFTANGDPAALRLTAALAVRNGMTMEAAWAAVTSVPARMLGIADSTGSLAVGRRADLVVYDGHPLNLSASVEAVFLGGVAVDLKD